MLEWIVEYNVGLYVNLALVAAMAVAFVRERRSLRGPRS